MFVDEEFAFTRTLESDWRAIHQEMTALRSGAFLTWPEHSLHDQGWRTYGLYAFGQKQEENCRLCPRTTALVEAIPGMVMAGFSRLAPGTKIKPHRGYDAYSRFVLRLHLGLETNAGSALRVGAEVRRWEPGRALIFCDATEHEAWNNGDSERTILLVDFRSPRHRRRWLNPALSAEFVQFIEQERWPMLSWRERMAWRMWKLARLGRASPPATGADPH